MRKFFIPLGRNGNRRGNVAVVTAIVMTVLAGVFALVLDSGLLYSEKNRFQNAVEAAALAGASSLCRDEPLETARRVLMRNLFAEGREDEDLPENYTLEMTAGFYDESDAYEDFSEYRDFAGAANMPGGEFGNAVLVRLIVNASTLGVLGKKQVRIGAAAVAYLKRYDMVSLNPGGEIRLGGGSIWSNGDILAAGDIKYPGPPKTPPVFNSVGLYAGGQVLSCPVYVSWFGETILWNSGSPSGLPNAFPGSPEITDIRPSDDDYLESLRAKADKIYYPGDAHGGVLIGHCPAGPIYLFCLGLHHPDRVTYFFDASGSPGAEAVIINAEYNPSLCSQELPPHIGDTPRNVTFAANCPITVHAAGTLDFHFGGAGDDQVILVSSQTIKVEGTRLSLDGVTFRCGGDFVQGLGEGYNPKRMRVITGGDIKDQYNHGVRGEFDFLFGPPCPPVIPKLGKVESSAP